MLPNTSRDTVRTNIKLCFPDYPEDQRQQLVRQCLEETGKTLLESSALWLWSVQRVQATVRKISGADLIEKAMASGHGVILAMPHLGAWELTNLYCSAHWSITTLYRTPRLHGLDTLIREARQRGGATLVPTDSSGVRALYKALGRGELVAILPDQDPGREAGVFAPFFGILANTMTLLPRLARKSGAVVLFAYAERLPRGKGYHLHFCSAPEGMADENLERAATSLNQGIEDCVRQLPAQYQWGYKRFKRQPEQGKDLY